MSQWLFVAVWCAACSAHGSLAPGPDGFGYTVQATTNFSFVQITNGSPRVLALQDDTPFTAAIGFTFNFYGSNYTNLSFNPNGLITFGGASSNYFNVDLTNSSPSNNLPCIAVLWDDWEAQSPWSDGVYYKTTGTAPARQFTVQWNKVVPVAGNGTNTVTFEARLFEGSSRILLSYFDVLVSDETTNVASLGKGATVGIRDLSGQTNNHNLQWSYNQAVITNGLNLLFAPPNHPPVANDDSATTTEDTAITITVKSNDADTDNDTLTLVSASEGTNGTVTTNASGTVTYRPTTNFFGTDHFTYVISDGWGGSATGNVTVTVTPVNDQPMAEPDAFSTYQNVPLTFNHTLLLTNDSDVDVGDILDLASLSTNSAAGGIIRLSGSNVTYIPALNFSGSDTFNYTITDGHGGSATGLVTITVISNNPPITSPNFFNTTQNVALIFSYTLLLTNDSDVDAGDVLDLVSLSTNSSAGGIVSLSGTNVTYIPALNFSGADAFNYTITDGHGASATGLVTVTVVPTNYPPTAAPDAFDTYQNVPLTFNYTLLLTNDSDVDVGDVLDLASLSTNSTAGGIVSLSGSNVTYIPALNFSGSDTFNYTITDGHGGSATGLVTITVFSNNPPVAGPDFFSTTQNLVLSFSYALLLANDSDIDAGDVLNLLSLSTNSVAGGSVSLSGSNVTYIPALNFAGSDTFNYAITDGHGGSATGLVTVTVAPTNHAPMAVSDSFSTYQNQPLTFDYTLLLTNDSDVDVGDVLNLATLSTNSTTGGNVSLSGSNVTYIPVLNFSGSDSFNYTITDGHGGSATGLVTITVISNNPPVTSPDFFSTTQNVALTFSYTLLLTNDSDVDVGDILDQTSLSTNSTAGGTVSLSGSNVTYIPALDFSGSDSFTYTITDGHGGSATGLVTVTVVPTNYPPTAAPDAFDTYQNLPLSLNYTLLLTNDWDVDVGDLLDLASMSTNSAAGGIISLSGSNVTYIPALNFSGSDTFNYTITDGHGGSATGLVTITVISNNPPVASPDFFSTTQNVALIFSYTLLLTNDSDVDVGDILDLTSLSTNSTAGGTVSLSGSNVTYIPALDFSGSDTFNYTITDGHGGSATGLVTVTVVPTNYPPTAEPDAFDTYQNVPLTFNYTLLLTNDSDVDVGDVLDLASLSTNSAAGGRVSLSGSNVTYIPALNFSGSDTFNYTITDGHGGSATGLVTVVVWPPPNLNWLRWQTNGNPILGFQGMPGQQHTVEASVDFTNWSGIGVASETSPGAFEFEDTGAGGWPARFYRLRAP